MCNMYASAKNRGISGSTEKTYVIEKFFKTISYLYSTDYIERYMGFNKEVTGDTINGVNIVGKLAFSFGISAMSKDMLDED